VVRLLFFAVMLGLLMGCSKHSNCPAYASVKTQERKHIKKNIRKKKKKSESGLFTKEQLNIIRSGKKAARKSKRNLKKKS
jgi:hypothetical protein